MRLIETHYVCVMCFTALGGDLMRFLTAKEVSVVMRIPLARVYELARLSLIPSVRMGRQIRFDESALREWAARGGTDLHKGELKDGAPFAA
jgi:excisionase family DNA binding protein